MIQILELFVHAISEILREIGYGTIINTGTIYVYATPLYDNTGLICCINFHDYIEINSYWFKTEATQCDYGDPELIDKLQIAINKALLYKNEYFHTI